MFLTVVSAGLRRGEVLGLRWGEVALADPAGAALRVREMFVRGMTDTPKSRSGCSGRNPGRRKSGVAT